MTWDDGIEDELDREYIQGLKRRAEVAGRERDALAMDLVKALRERDAACDVIAMTTARLVAVLQALGWQGDDPEGAEEYAAKVRAERDAAQARIVDLQECWQCAVEERRTALDRLSHVELTLGATQADLEHVRGVLRRAGDVLASVEWQSGLGDFRWCAQCLRDHPNHSADCPLAAVRGEIGEVLR